MAPARGPWGFRHHGTSRHQTPTSVHARFRAGNGEERGRTQHARNPATLPLESPQPHRVRPASVRGPWSRHRLENPTAKALFARSRAQPSARRPPAACGGSVITGRRGSRRPPARMHALGLGTGQSGAEPSTLATPPCSCSRAPSRIAFAPLNSGSHGRVPCSPPPLPFSRALGGVPGGGGRIRARWPACARQTGAARLRMGGEKESARTGVADEHAGWRALAQVPACPRLSAHPRTHLAATAPHFSPVCAPLLAEFFNFFTDISV